MNLKNNIQLIGNVGELPTVTSVGESSKVARISLATNRSYKDAEGNKQTATQWHTVEAWGHLAELAENYIDKGKEIAIGGELQYNTYEDSEGVKRTKAFIRASEIQLLGSK